MNRFASLLMTRHRVAGLLLGLLVPAGLGAQPARQVSLEVTALLQNERIELRWSDEGNPDRYIINRATGEGAFQPLGQVAGGTLAYTDENVQPGQRYEYYLQRVRNDSLIATGYLSTGIELPPVERQGDVLVLVDSTTYSVLGSKIRRAERLLWADGWQVSRMQVGRQDSPPVIRSRIRSWYNDTATDGRALWIMGQVPVPYSGGFRVAPDAHRDHNGAWPADVYYGSLQSSWEDVAVNNDSTRVANRNLPQDGRFDKTYLERAPDLMVGRTSFHQMPAFSDSAEALLAGYLERHHSFRTGQWQPREKAVIEDNFANLSEGFSQTGWRGFSALLGTENVSEGEYFETLRDSGALLSYGSGGGSFRSASGIATSQDFADTSVHGAFTFLFGSYFGDWNTPNNFLRAPLAAKAPMLTNAWAGRPHWYLHPMAAGHPIGRSLLMAQTNGLGQTARYQPTGFAATGVHIALMGDPTLRLYHFAPPEGLTPAFKQLEGVDSAGIELRWSAASGAGVQGYAVYRQIDSGQVFERLHTGFVEDTAFVDSFPHTDRPNVYMLRPYVLKTTGSGLMPYLGTGALDTTGPARSKPAAVSTYRTDAPQIQLWPNPVETQFTLSAAQPIAGFRLVNALGKTVHAESFAQARREVRCPWPGLPGGHYVVLVRVNGRLYARQLIHP